MNEQDTIKTIESLLATSSVKEALEAVEKEEQKQKRLLRLIFGFGTVIGIALLVAIIMLPILKIYGTSMEPTLSEGDVVVSVKSSDVKQGDLISFYFNNNILVKRVIASGGDWVDIDQAGNVLVNGNPLEESYVQEKAFGKCDITLPYQVPEGCYFVMGDNRVTSLDSRSRDIGAISNEKYIGKIRLCLWPLNKIKIWN